MITAIIIVFLVLAAIALEDLPSPRTLRTHDAHQLAALRVDVATRGVCIVALVAGVVVLALLEGTVR